MRPEPSAFGGARGPAGGRVAQRRCARWWRRQHSPPDTYPSCWYNNPVSRSVTGQIFNVGYSEAYFFIFLLFQVANKGARDGVFVYAGRPGAQSRGRKVYEAELTGIRCAAITERSGARAVGGKLISDYGPPQVASFTRIVII